MNTVYKFELPTDDYFSVDIPEDAKVLTVQTQHQKPCMWVLLDPNKPTNKRTFRLAGTGHPITEDSEILLYIGTFQLFNGSFIGHLFEILK